MIYIYIYIFVELDYLVEDIYCYSEFHAPPRAIIRQLPKLTDTKDDVSVNFGSCLMIAPGGA